MTSGAAAYIVRRTSDADRFEVSRSLSDVQQRINQHRALLRIEAPVVGAAYRDLTDTTREVAGPLIRSGWDERDTATMNVNIDLAGLEPAEDAFVEAVEDHLAVGPLWLTHLQRRLRPVVGRRSSP